MRRRKRKGIRRKGEQISTWHAQSREQGNLTQSQLLPRIAVPHMRCACHHKATRHATARTHIQPTQCHLTATSYHIWRQVYVIYPSACTGHSFVLRWFMGLCAFPLGTSIPIANRMYTTSGTLSKPFTWKRYVHSVLKASSFVPEPTALGQCCGSLVLNWSRRCWVLPYLQTSSMPIQRFPFLQTLLSKRVPPLCSSPCTKTSSLDSGIAAMQ
jgi:hypothetical protein